MLNCSISQNILLEESLFQAKNSNILVIGKGCIGISFFNFLITFLNLTGLLALFNHGSFYDTNKQTVYDQ